MFTMSVIQRKWARAAVSFVRYFWIRWDKNNISKSVWYNQQWMNKCRTYVTRLTQSHTEKKNFSIKSSSLSSSVSFVEKSVCCFPFFFNSFFVIFFLILKKVSTEWKCKELCHLFIWYSVTTFDVMNQMQSTFYERKI